MAKSPKKQIQVDKDTHGILLQWAKASHRHLIDLMRYIAENGELSGSDLIVTPPAKDKEKAA